MIIQGDCIQEMKKLKENSVDAIITDPPYGLGFMGKEWDTFKPEYVEEAMEKDKRPHTQIASQRRSNAAGGMSSYWLGVKTEGHLGFQTFFYQFAKACLRVLKPGGFLLSFGGTRTYHRLVCGIEDAGFEIRDTIMWLYGSGFPKSLNIGKQIDKMNEKFYNKDFYNYLNKKRKEKGITLRKINQECGYSDAGGGMSSYWLGVKTEGHFHGLPSKKDYKILKELLELDNRFDKLINKTEAEREVLEKKWRTPSNKPEFSTQWGFGAKTDGHYNITKPNLPEAKEWEGWGTALKPACEPIVVARKPLSEKNVALNVLKWGTGGINIDECRIGSEQIEKGNAGRGEGHKKGTYKLGFGVSKEKEFSQGRFPANIILDEEAGKMLDEQTGELKSGSGAIKKATSKGYQGNDYGVESRPEGTKMVSHNDIGGASRFFYCAKASKGERNLGCEEMEDKTTDDGREVISDRPHQRGATQRKNNHPTVKPIKLMEYLVKLVSKEGATVLDPFLGSGTTAIACVKLGRNCIGIEKEAEYLQIAKSRIKVYTEQRRL